MPLASTPPQANDPAARRRIRERLLTAIPSSYRPWMHLAATTGIGAAVLALGIFGIHGLRPVELLVVPAVFLLSNGFEWRAHKDLLHKMREPLGFLYRRHTPEHHMIYVEDDMAIRDWREMKVVLIPAYGVFGIVATLAPVAALFGALATRNAGWLVLVTGGLYMVGYELSHLSYHLPPESFVGRLALVRVLRRHHARHHNPALMQRWNFNVTIPLFDWVHGTIAPAREEGAEEPSSPEAPEAVAKSI
ncbi:MAG: sterol desaturase family protein [Polyangiaceae bacterium]|jgi:hypothetical protein